MELRLYRSFVVAASHSTFSAAATALSMSQPALTKQIQQLERWTGTALFLRGRQGSALTQAGLQLLADARDVVDRADRLAARIKRVAAGDEGHLAVGFGLSSISVAPEAVATFRHKFPGVAVSLEDLSSAEQFERILAGSLDFAFARLPAPAEFACLQVLSDRLALAATTQWPNSQVQDEDLRTWLAEHELVQLSAARGPGLRAQIRQFYEEIGCEPAIIQEAADLQTVLALVAAGVGGAVVPASAASIAPKTVAMIPIDRPGAAWEVGLVWLRGQTGPRFEAFLEIVHKMRLPISPIG
ncbi:LysR family transcriptional regulator [Pseudarthrobacter sp. Y6]|uniref:LysR family transcriptional regulator n=1 Tax=Pseudarthrobacter sp. Y6 TaxID=3418422 RepID=UPI003CEB4F4F